MACIPSSSWQWDPPRLHLGAPLLRPLPRPAPACGSGKNDNDNDNDNGSRADAAVA